MNYRLPSIPPVRSTPCNGSATASSSPNSARAATITGPGAKDTAPHARHRRCAQRTHSRQRHLCTTPRNRRPRLHAGPHLSRRKRGVARGWPRARRHVEFQRRGNLDARRSASRAANPNRRSNPRPRDAHARRRTRARRRPLDRDRPHLRARFRLPTTGARRRRLGLAARRGTMAASSGPSKAARHRSALPRRPSSARTAATRFCNCRLTTWVKAKSRLSRWRAARSSSTCRARTISGSRKTAVWIELGGMLAFYALSDS